VVEGSVRPLHASFLTGRDRFQERSRPVAVITWQCWMREPGSERVLHHLTPFQRIFANRRLRPGISRVGRRASHPSPDAGDQPHVVIVGGGFGGLNVAKGLRDAALRITLVDQQNHHLFQPLLYQVATASLSPADIASPIRTILRDQQNTTVVQATVTAIDLAQRTVQLRDGAIPYDMLVLAMGVEPAYFGHPEWAAHAPGLKSIDDAVEMRRRIFSAFERAERAPDAPARQRALTFVVVGGGPTGVELAGAIGEIAHHTLTREFRNIDPEDARILMIDSGDRLLSGFPERASVPAERDLGRLGVEIRTGSRVTGMDPGVVWLGDERIEADTVLWAAGVRASPVATTLGVPLDRVGRVIVAPDLTIPGHPDVFVIGDLAAVVDREGVALPGTAPVAIQAAQQTVPNLLRQLNGEPTEPFTYRDRGMMATVGRGRAVAVIAGRTFDGLVAWLLWAVIHVWSLIEFRSRAAVMLQWGWAFLTRQRTARLITGVTATAGESRSPGTYRDQPAAVRR
jgi:NADH dehydrogenase